MRGGYGLIMSIIIETAEIFTLSNILNDRRDILGQRSYKFPSTNEDESFVGWRSKLRSCVDVGSGHQMLVSKTR